MKLILLAAIAFSLQSCVTESIIRRNPDGSKDAIERTTFDPTPAVDAAVRAYPKRISSSFK